MPFPVMLVVLFGAVLHAAWNGLVKGGSDRYLDTAALMFATACVCIPAILVLPHVERSCWGYLALSATLHLAYFSLIARSYQLGDMSVVYPVTRGTSPAITAVGSVVLLDRLGSGEWAGVVLISCGVVLLAFDHGNRKSAERKSPTPILLALLNAIAIAAYTLTDGRGARISQSAAAYTCWSFVLTAALFVPISIAIRGRAPMDHLRMHWKRGLLGGACSVGAYATALWAMTQTTIASVAALRETAILFGVLFASIRLKEPVSRARWAAVMLVLAGAIAIRLR